MRPYDVMRNRGWCDGPESEAFLRMRTACEARGTRRGAEAAFRGRGIHPRLGRCIDCASPTLTPGRSGEPALGVLIEKHGLWTEEQGRQAEELKRRVETEDLRLVRVAWGDPHGVSRAKAVAAGVFGALSDGYNINVATTTLDPPTPEPSPVHKGRRNGVAEMTGSPNLIIVPTHRRFGCCRGRQASARSCATITSVPACRSTSRRGTAAQALGRLATRDWDWSLASRSSGIFCASPRID